MAVMAESKSAGHNPQTISQDKGMRKESEGRNRVLPLNEIKLQPLPGAAFKTGWALFRNSSVVGGSVATMCVFSPFFTHAGRKRSLSPNDSLKTRKRVLLISRNNSVSKCTVETK